MQPEVHARANSKANHASEPMFYSARPPRRIRLMVADTIREKLKVSLLMPDPTKKQNGDVTTSRRHLPRASAAVGGAALAGGISRSATAADADNLPPNVPEWMKMPGDPMGSQPY